MNNIILDNSLFSGSDPKTQIYGKSFNQTSGALIPVDVDKAAKTWNDLDLSALGVYLGKCVEQEINSSVVQLMREYCGIQMPRYYCKFDQTTRRNDAAVRTGENRYVFLNDRASNNSNDLKSIPLGDAYYALETLMEEDRRFFSGYPVLFNERFKHCWRSLNNFRNSIAHIGTVINRDIIVDFLSEFKKFMGVFLSQLAKIKDDLDDKWREQKPILNVTPDYGTTFTETYSKQTPTGKPKATSIEAQSLRGITQQYNEYAELFLQLDKKASSGANLTKEEIDATEREARRYNEKCGLLFREVFLPFKEKYDWFDLEFSENGKIGIKNVTGEIMVPAQFDEVDTLREYNYCDIHYCPPLSKLYCAAKNGKFALIVGDGSGRNITEFKYAGLRTTPYGFCLYYNDCDEVFGLLSNFGEELTPCVIDAYYFPTDGCVVFRRGEQYGMYHFEWHLYIPPEYDDIYAVGVGEEIQMTKDGVPGYYKMIFDENGKFSEGKFLSKKDYDERGRDVDILCCSDCSD